MATYCIKCGGTGHAPNNKFCTCSDGKLLKAMASAREKADQAKAEREAQEKETEKARKKLLDAKKEVHSLLSDEEEDKPKNNFAIGDWVKHAGIIGVVGAIDGRVGKLRFLGVRTDEGDKSKPYDVGAWVPINRVTHAALETFEDVHLPMLFVQLEHELNINYALDTGNKELFMELTDSE